MSIVMKDQTRATKELFNMLFLNVPEYSWYFTFTTINHDLKLKTHFIPNISFKKQTIRKDRKGLCCSSKIVWSIRLEFTDDGFEALMERSKKYELYLDVMFGNIDNLRSMLKLPYLSTDKKLYNVDVEDIIGNGIIYFEKMQIKLVNDVKKVIIIRFQESGVF